MAMGESIRHNLFKNPAETMNKTKFKIRNDHAKGVFSFPLARGHSFVLGFFKSIFKSVILLNVIAELLAVTIQIRIRTIILNGGNPCAAITIDERAKGSANILCENLIIVRILRNELKNLLISEGINRGKVGCLEGRIDPENDADTQRESKAEYSSPERHMRTGKAVCKMGNYDG